jgi:hypothetical protein
VSYPDWILMWLSVLEIVWTRCMNRGPCGDDENEVVQRDDECVVVQGRLVHHYRCRCTEGR